MRKVRDYDAELEALAGKARALKDRKVRQLGELVIATGADALPIDELTGVLVMVARSIDAAAKENWRAAGSTFLHGTKQSSSAPRSKPRGVPTPSDGEAAN